MSEDFKVKDISLADFGRKEISLAETEMPGLMALRTEYKGKHPRKGARILGCRDMTIQTGVLIETLVGPVLLEVVSTALRQVRDGALEHAHALGFPGCRT